MSQEKITIDVTKREVVGKGLRGLRSSGQTPAVIHNHGGESILVTGGSAELIKAYKMAGKHHPVELIIGKSNHLAIIRDVDFEPTKHTLRHVVFQAIKQNETTEAEIPVLFSEGVEIPAVKKSLLVLKQLDTVDVKALPRDLPESISVDPSKLIEVGDSVAVSDLIVPKGVTVLTDPDTQIAIIEMPRDQIAEADASAAALAEDSDKPTAEESTQATDVKTAE